MSEIIYNSKKRIKEVRQKDVEIVVKKEGKPVENVGVKIRMKEHDFLFGAVCYQYGTFKDEKMNEIFTEKFVKLFNYTMIPYHWSWYEPKKGEYNEPYASNLIKWAKANNLKRKLHALVWHELCPDWVTSDDNITDLYKERITHLMTNYASEFNFIDVANETTVNDRFDNPVSRWVKEFGPVNMVKYMTDFVREFNPKAKLIYGDWNVHGDDYYKFLDDMRQADVKIDLLGVQSHMHVDLWTHEETIRVMDKASSFGWPLHFPECSLCSGKPDGQTSYSAGAKNKWIEKEEDLYTQAELAKDFYTMVFSHPSVEALSWFDFIDHRWLGAPAGVVTDDLKIKPIYETLYDLIHKQWHSDADISTGSEGNCKTRLFFGTYEITVEKDGILKTISHKMQRPHFYTGKEETSEIIKIEI